MVKTDEVRTKKWVFPEAYFHSHSTTSVLPAGRMYDTREVVTNLDFMRDMTVTAKTCEDCPYNCYHNKTAQQKKLHSSVFLSCASLRLHPSDNIVQWYGLHWADWEMCSKLREHKPELGCYHRDWHVSVHCNDCGCEHSFRKCSASHRNVDNEMREIVEALLITKASDWCISCPSVAFHWMLLFLKREG